MKKVLICVILALVTHAQAASSEISPKGLQCKLVVFDLDGTLSKSKCPMDTAMSDLLTKLLRTRSVAVISGGSYAQYQKQFLASLNCPQELLPNLYLFPTCSTAFYRFQNGQWTNVYRHVLSDDEKKSVMAALRTVIKNVGHNPTRTYGDIIEDRDSQITFSALGQQAPLEAKKTWDPDGKKRMAMKDQLEQIIPAFEIRIGGTTSIDITHKGIDKKYGVEQIQQQLGFAKDEIVFVGDALFEGGNDYPVKATGVECISVDSPEDTQEVIGRMLAAEPRICPCAAKTCA